MTIEKTDRRKSYDAIEDAINLAKKSPTRTWDEMTKESPDKKQTDHDRKAASVGMGLK